MKSEIIRCTVTHQDTAGSGSPTLKEHSVDVDSAQVPFGHDRARKRSEEP